MKPNGITMTINKEQELFVFSNQAGVSCLGFKICQGRIDRMAEWLGEEKSQEDELGTELGYNRYTDYLLLCKKKSDAQGIKCPCELTEQLIGLEGKRVEVEDKWGERRRFVVGKSTGWMPIHLELKSNRSDGGEGVMGAPFIRIQVI